MDAKTMRTQYFGLELKLRHGLVRVLGAGE